MNLRAAVKVCHTDYRIAARISDCLRFRFGMDYQQSQEWVQERNPKLTPDKWEALMYEADYYGPER